MTVIEGSTPEITSFEGSLPGLRALSLRENFTWTLAGNAIYAACQWGMLIVLAKLGSPVFVGRFALGLAVTAPVIIFSALQLRAVMATDAKQDYEFGDYLGLRLLTMVGALLVIVGISIGSGYPRETALVILFVGVAKVFELISDVFYGLLQFHERMDRIAISMMIKGPLSLVTFSVGVMATHSVLGGAIGLLLAWALILGTYDIRSGALIMKAAKGSDGLWREALRPRFDWPTLLKLARVSLPLGFVMLLLSLNTNIPRYFIEGHLGERGLGFFAAIAYLMVVQTMVIAALGQSASPRLAKYYADKDTASFLNLLGKLIAIGASIGIVGILVALVAGRDLLTALYGPEYAGRTDVLVWLMTASCIMNIVSYLGVGMTAARFFKAQVPLVGVAAGTTAIACFLLVPSKGMHGACVAIVLSSLILMAGCVAVNAYAVISVRKRIRTS